MKFEKIGNRFKLSPRERIITLLKEKNEIAISSLMRLAHIQYNYLEKILEKLQKTGQIIIIKDDICDIDDRPVFSKKTIKLVKHKSQK